MQDIHLFSVSAEPDTSWLTQSAKPSVTAHVVTQLMVAMPGGRDRNPGIPGGNTTRWSTHADSTPSTHTSSCPPNAQVVKEKQAFQRLTITKENLLRMFAYNKFKIRIITERITTPTTTVYRCGPLIDLCRGPHVRHTGKVEQIALTKNSATYWEGAYQACRLPVYCTLGRHF